MSKIDFPKKISEKISFEELHGEKTNLSFFQFLEKSKSKNLDCPFFPSQKGERRVSRDKLVEKGGCFGIASGGGWG
jgi:hypothetical protein